MSEKRVMVFIVEGRSDEVALGSIMKGYFSDNEVRFVVIRGDITTKDYVSADSILEKINQHVESVKEKYRYRFEDFVKIVHLTDADGVFIGKEKVKFANVERIQYYTDHVKTSDVDAIIDRNTRKAEILFKLRRTGKIHGIPYRIYFNSCNLEHVLYHELRDFSDEEKINLSDEFAERYEGRTEEFIEFISGSEVAVSGTYQQTWSFLEKKSNSLNRHSNMHLLFRK